MPVVDPTNNHMFSLFPKFSPMRIKYKDIFSFNEFFNAMHEWLMEQGWEAHDGDLDHWETLYTEKVDRNGLKEHLIRWRLRKKPANSTYLMYYLDIDFHTVALGSTEIVRGNQKIKADKGELELTITAFTQEIFRREFEKSPLLKFITSLFSKRIYNSWPRIKDLYLDVYALNNFIKQWFKLKRYLPYEETKSYYPSQSYPSHLKE